MSRARKKPELVTIERGQLDELIAEHQLLRRRVESLENKGEFGSPDSHKLDCAAAILSLTESMFGTAGTIEHRIGDVGEANYFVVSVNVGLSADPKDMAAKHTMWHQNVARLPIPQDADLRLKVTYK